jgi:hypothetical protein
VGFNLHTQVYYLIIYMYFVWGSLV